MKNLSGLVGNTPIVEVPYNGNMLHLKIEAQNPGLSIKDRVAFYVCKVLSEQGDLSEKRIVEYSSGNLAIGLAQASKIWNFDLTLVVTGQTSPDKIKLLKRLGATIVMVNGAEDSDAPLGFRGFAKRIADEQDAILIDQYHNPLNQESHYRTTGPEIHRAVPQARYVFSPMGTGGTASGIARYLRDVGSSTKVVGVTTAVGIYYTTYYGLDEKRPGSDTSLIEGVGEDLIPGNLNLEVLGKVVEVRDDLALLEIDNLLSETGLFVGGSSGLAVAAAKQVIDVEGLSGEDLVVLCPDSGNRYLSANLPSERSKPTNGRLKEFVESNSDGSFPKIL